MAEKAYSAGTIFLQVVPVFRDMLKETRSQAQRTGKALGDEMEKAGADAGRRASKAMGEELGKGSDKAGKDAGEEYAGHFAESFQRGIKKLERELKPIRLKTATESAMRDLEEIRAEMKALSDVKVGVDLDAGKAHARLVALLGEVKALQKAAADIDTKVNLDEAAKGIEGFIARIEKANPTITVDVDTKALDRAMGATEKRFREGARTMAASLDKETSPAVARLKKRLEDVADTSVDFDFSRARAEIAEVSRELKGLAQDESADFVIRADAGEAYRAAAAVNALGNEIDGQHWDVTVDLDAKAAEAEMGAFERRVRETAKKASANLGTINPTLRRIKDQFAEISNPDITPELNGERVIAELRGLAGEVKAVATDETINIDVRMDAAKAYAELVPLMKAFSAIDGKTLDVNVDLDAGKAVAQASALRVAMSRLTGGGDEAANSFRAFNFIIFGVVTLLPALIPVLGAVGGGLLALVPILGAVGAGLATLLIGFSGIGPILKGYSDVQKNAGQDALVAGKRIRGAARSVEDAERSLARARQNASQGAADAARNVARAQEQSARSIASALRSQQDAERNLARAQRDARQAQDDLRVARRKAQEELEAAKDNRAKNALDVRQGVVDVFNSTVAYNATMQDGASTNLDKEVASINLERARLALKEARDEQARLAQEQKDQQKNGIEGTDAVQNANDKLTAALERQRDAQRAVGDAAAAVNQARIDGARSVQDALRAQDRQAEQSAQAIGDAQRNLTQANEDYATAVSEQSTSVRNLNDALAHVGPAGRKFAAFIFGLRDDAYAIRDSIQEAMLPGVQAGLQAIIDTYGPQFRVFAADMGGVMGRLFKQAGQGLGNEPWREFFGTYSKIAPRLLEEFGQTTGNWMGVYARLFTIVAPYAERFSLALLAISENALDFMQSTEGANYWTSFMDYVARVGPLVADFFWNLLQATIDIGKALAPWGETVLKALDGVLQWIVAMDPDTLAFIATSLIGVVLAFQAATGAVALLAGGMTILGSPLALAVFLIVGLGTALYAAYQNSETFRGVVDALFGFVADNLETLKTFGKVIGIIAGAFLLYKGYMLAVSGAQTAYLTGLMAIDFYNGKIRKAMALSNALLKIQVAWTWLQVAATWALNSALLANPITWVVLAVVALIAVLVLLYKKNETVRKVIDAAWAGIKASFKAVGDAFVWLWQNAIKPVIDWIIGAFTAVGHAIKAIWDGWIFPVIDLFWHIVILLWNSAIKPYFGFVIGLWKALGQAFIWVWKNVLGPVFSLFGAIVKDLWHKVMDPIFGWIGRRWADMAKGFRIVWNTVLKPIFDAFKDHVLPKLKTAFEVAVAGIKTLWNGLKEIIAAPIRFVIETVLNKGLIAGFNWVAKKVGSKPMSEIPMPDGLRQGGQKKATSPGGQGGAGRTAYATGGVLPGYTPGRDVHEFYSPTGGRLSLSGGEAIMRPEFTAAMGNDGIDALNRLARQQGVAGLRRVLGQQAFAKGGVFWPVPGRQTGTYPGHNGVDINRGSGWDDYGDPIWAFRDGKITYVGTGRGYGQAIMERGPGYPEVVYGHTSKVYVKAGQTVRAGDLIGRVGNTGNSSAPHLHFGLVQGGTTANALALLGGAKMADGGGLGAPGWLKALGSDVKGWLTDKITGQVEKVTEKFGHSDLMQTVVGVGKKLIEPVAGKMGQMIDGLKSGLEKVVNFTPAGMVANALASIVGGKGVVADVKAVASAYGWGSGAEWKAIDWIISHESGWNPDAANPSSSARGLFQKMTSIHGPVEKTATGQAKWGLDYIAQRYGDPLAAKRYWESHGSYADGGVLPSTPGGVPDNGTMMYDNGGYLPPGLTTVLNLTGKPEPVFTADQFDRMGGGTGEGIHYEPHFEGSDLTAQDVAFDLDVTFRRMARGSKRYAGR